MPLWRQRRPGVSWQTPLPNTLTMLRNFVEEKMALHGGPDGPKGINELTAMVIEKTTEFNDMVMKVDKQGSERENRTVELIGELVVIALLHPKNKEITTSPQNCRTRTAEQGVHVINCNCNRAACQPACIFYIKTTDTLHAWASIACAWHARTRLKMGCMLLAIVKIRGERLAAGQASGGAR